MTKQIESVPEFISHEDYMAWFRHCGFTPSDVLSLKFTGRGIYAKTIERDENGAKMFSNDQSELITNTVFIPVRKSSLESS